MGAQLGVDAVGADHDLGLGGGAVRESDARELAVLLEADRAVAGVHASGGQVCREELDEVGAVHAEARVPPVGVRHLDRGDRRPVVAKIRRARAHPRAPSFHGWPEADPLEVAHRVRGDINARPDLAERRRLLIDRNPQPLRDQRIGGEQAADAASDDQDAWPQG